ncbi:MAG: GTP-binding protein YchF [Candidatus Woesebacteria bacterium GW2011_GWA1_41_13b]|uniref:GTP-binding protein YchF n=1 Tax=Candidatus Woesebacteria bacterium GW2011_GWA1_41_13b TaxID=1618555 RepID=A0A0G0X2Z1_9BACT|nr:MAG: GTP-binding protein YchF [Candidatus Woesebacteria bacterium GW2011_GWA1_41_13b]
MGLSVGIIGLPNVGKSTLFNALLKKQQALAANYPFATIEPNVGVVPVPDDRLAKLAEVVHTTKIVPATVKFVDIAGLVKGASTGEGLGNKFLAHIREVDAIAMVLRDFSDENVIRAGSENPKSDAEVLETELIMADLQTVEKSKEPLAKRIAENLQKAVPVRDMSFTDEEVLIVKQMNLLTYKPVIKVLNVDEDKIVDSSEFIVLSAKLESELGDEIKDLGISESGLEKLIKKAYEILGLQSFLTAGEIEARAWTIRRGSTALMASSVIHEDFAKNFIKADIIYWEDFVRLGGWAKAREAGKVRMEGKEYVMAEGDVVEFKVGV